MLNLLRLSWWTRVWVVQELVLAKKATLVVGSTSIPWELISKVCDSYFKHLPPGACCHSTVAWKMSSELWDEIILMRLTFWSFYTLRNEMLQPQGKHPSTALWEFLWLLRHKQATNPRDKVYGLLGLFQSQQDPFLVPDYSMTAAETFSRCIEALIKSDDSLRALIGPRLRHSGLPTWVIDLLPKESSGSPLFFQNLFRRLASAEIFNACATQKLSFSLHSSRLCVRGVAVDKVKDSATAWKEGFVAPTFKEWEVLSGITHQYHESNYPDGGTRANAFWRTMIRDTIRDYYDGEKVRRANSADKASFDLFRRWLTEQPGANNADIMADPGFANFRKSIFIATQDQNFFITHRGYMGLGYLPQSNDEIWILYGGCVPFILRPYPNDSENAGCYSLVGDCYVHGIMDGEAMTHLGESEAREVFLI